MNLAAAFSLGIRVMSEQRHDLTHLFQETFTVFFLGEALVKAFYFAA